MKTHVNKKNYNKNVDSLPIYPFPKFFPSISDFYGNYNYFSNKCKMQNIKINFMKLHNNVRNKI